MVNVAQAQSSEMAERIQPCTACHGEQGRAGPDGYYPRLAGKPEGYLFHQMQNFVQGRRQYPLMKRLLMPLSDEAQHEFAHYLSQLTVAYPAPAKSVSDYPAALIERGRQLALDGDASLQLPACTACHGAALMGRAPDVPGLLGLPLAYVSAQWSAWREGKRQTDAPDCMAKVMKHLSMQDAASVGAWLSIQPITGVAFKTNPAPLASQDGCGSAPSLTAKGAR